MGTKTSLSPRTGPPVAPITDMILPLENGDRLTRREFERRYRAMPDVKKAELIEGIVSMASPVRATKHGEPHSNMNMWVCVFVAYTPGTKCFDNTSLRIDQDNEFQPDVALCVEESRGGSSRITEDDYLEGAPELVIEIAASSASYDLHDKLNVYRRNGVREYIVWRVADAAIDWFRLEDERYVLVGPDDDGIIESSTFGGLRLNVPAMLAGDTARVLADLQAGIAARN